MADYNQGDRSAGALFKVSERKSDKHPSMTGELTLTKALLKELIEEAKVGNPIKLSISAWNNTARSGLQYIALTAKKWVPPKELNDETPF
jgi:hypothetical protein